MTNVWRAAYAVLILTMLAGWAGMGVVSLVMISGATAPATDPMTLIVPGAVAGAVIGGIVMIFSGPPELETPPVEKPPAPASMPAPAPKLKPTPKPTPIKPPMTNAERADSAGFVPVRWSPQGLPSPAPGPLRGAARKWRHWWWCGCRGCNHVWQTQGEFRHDFKRIGKLPVCDHGQPVQYTKPRNRRIRDFPL